MKQKFSDDSKVLSIRLSASVLALVKTAAKNHGLTPSVYVRTMLYKKFCPEVE